MPQYTQKGLNEIVGLWDIYLDKNPEQRPIQALLNMVRDEYGTIPNVSWLWNMSEETIIGRMTDVLYPPTESALARETGNFDDMLGAV
jgi:hypothetical protein